MKNARILIADDHDIVLYAVRSLIEIEAGWEICGETKDGREAVEMSVRLKPDVVVLDAVMPGIHGVEATRQIRLQSSGTEVLIFTGTDSEELVHQIFAAGALACVIKDEANEHLIPAIKSLCAHLPYMASRTSRVVFERYLEEAGMPPESASAGNLTRREREALQLLVKGKSNKDVGGILGISAKTVETHRASIMRKLGLNSFSEMVLYAVRNHIIEP